MQLNTTMGMQSNSMHNVTDINHTMCYHPCTEQHTLNVPFVGCSVCLIIFELSRWNADDLYYHPAEQHMIGRWRPLPVFVVSTRGQSSEISAQVVDDQPSTKMLATYQLLILSWRSSVKRLHYPLFGWAGGREGALKNVWCITWDRCKLKQIF